MDRRMFSTAFAALALAGCGTATKSSTDAFKGEDKKVAQVLEDLQSASQKGDAAEICSRILSSQLVDRMAARGSSCSQELDDAIGDADDFKIDVRGVQVSGTQATATVSNGEGPAQSVGLVRERRGWRLSELKAPAKS